MKKNVIICSSHLYVPTALTFILKHQNDSHYIYTSNSSIAKLFENSLLDVKVIKEPPRIDYPHIINSFKFKRWINREIAGIMPSSFLFFHDGYCMPVNWLMKKHCKNIPINYCPTYTDDVKKCKIKTFRQLFYFMSNKLLWGININPKKGLNGTQIPYLSPSFFKQIKAENIEISVDKQLINDNLYKICPSIASSSNKAIVFLQCELVAISISKDIYISYINKILANLDMSECLFKAKPGREKCFGNEQSLKKIPDYISASLILNTFKVVIGTSSTVLAQAANNGILSISLVELIPMQDAKEKKLVIDYLNNLSSNIKFPKSFEEFNELINNL